MFIVFSIEELKIEDILDPQHEDDFRWGIRSPPPKVVPGEGMCWTKVRVRLGMHPRTADKCRLLVQRLLMTFVPYARSYPGLLLLPQRRAPERRRLRIFGAPTSFRLSGVPSHQSPRCSQRLLRGSASETWKGSNKDSSSFLSDTFLLFRRLPLVLTEGSTEARAEPASSSSEEPVFRRVP